MAAIVPPRSAGIAHRRQSQLHWPPATRRNDAFQAKPQCRRLAREGKFHGPPGQRLGLAVEQDLGDLGRLVAGAGRPSLGITGPSLPEPSLGIAAPALQEPAPSVPALLFLQWIYKHALLLHDHRPSRGALRT